MVLVVYQCPHCGFLRMDKGLLVGSILNRAIMLCLSGNRKYQHLPFEFRKFEKKSFQKLKALKMAIQHYYHRSNDLHKLLFQPNYFLKL